MKKNVITILLFILIIGIGCNYIVDKDKHSVRLVKPDFVQSGLTGFLMDEAIVRQDFSSEESNIIEIKIRFATFNSELEGKYVLEIYRNDGIMKERQIIDGSDIIDNKYYRVILKNPLEKNQNYSMYIFPESELKESIAVWVGYSNSDRMGDFYENEEQQKVKLDIQFLEEDYYRPVIGFIVISAFVLLVVLSYIINSSKCIQIIYIVSLFFFVARGIDYLKSEYLGPYDEMTQISYLTYLEEEKDIIPEFKNMTMLVVAGTESEHIVQITALQQNTGIFAGEITDTVCYLGHPPLYYILLSLLDTVTIEDDIVYIDILDLRLFNFFIVVLAVALMFYIGYTRIEKDPKVHLLYAMIITSFPLLSYTSLTINNDNLTILTVAITMLGALRVYECKYDIKTYIIVAVGVCGTIMTKLTAGLIIVVAAVLMLIYKCFILKEKQCILNKNFFITLPIYILTLSYFVDVFLRYGTVQPYITDLVEFDVFKHYPTFYEEELQNKLGFAGFIASFFSKFSTQWVSGQYSVNGVFLSEGQRNIIEFIWCGLWLVVLYYCIGMFIKDNKKKFLGFFSCGIIATVTYQIFNAWGHYVDYGHGATQSRYYICILFIMALMMVNVFENIIIKFGQKKTGEIICNILINAVSLMFLYYGYVIYFV